MSTTKKQIYYSVSVKHVNRWREEIILIDETNNDEIEVTPLDQIRTLFSMYRRYENLMYDESLRVKTHRTDISLIVEYDNGDMFKFTYGLGGMNFDNLFLGGEVMRFSRTRAFNYFGVKDLVDKDIDELYNRLNKLDYDDLIKTIKSVLVDSIRFPLIKDEDEWLLVDKEYDYKSTSYAFPKIGGELELIWFRDNKLWLQVYTNAYSEDGMRDFECLDTNTTLIRNSDEITFKVACCKNKYGSPARFKFSYKNLVKSLAKTFVYVL